MNVECFAFSGGPCSAKTYCLGVLSKLYEEQVLVVPEVATALFAEGYELPKEPPEEWEDKVHFDLQATILQRQQKAEKDHLEIAAATGKRLVMCDRGQLDGAAYWPSGLCGFLSTFNLRAETVHECYVAVIHLESLATGRPDRYEKCRTSNPHRHEPLPLAQSREYAVRLAWSGHPNHHFLPTQDTADDQVQAVLTALRSYL